MPHCEWRRGDLYRRSSCRGLHPHFFLCSWPCEFPRTLLLETVWKVLGGRDGGLRSVPWRAVDTLRICPTTNGVTSARIFPSPQGGDLLGCTPYGRSSTPSSTS